MYRHCARMLLLFTTAHLDLNALSLAALNGVCSVMPGGATVRVRAAGAEEVGVCACVCFLWVVEVKASPTEHAQG